MFPFEFEVLAKGLSEQSSFSFDVQKIPPDQIIFNGMTYLPNPSRNNIPTKEAQGYVTFYKHDNLQLAVKVIPRKRYKSVQKELNGNLKLIDYPSDYIVPIIHASKNSEYFIFISHAKTMDLYDQLTYEKSNKIKPEFKTFINLILCVTKALSYLQKLKLVHHDVKLENIVFEKETNKFLLIDFDQLSSNKDQEYCYGEGTDGIVSLRRLNEKIATISDDIWSLSVVLYEYVTKSLSLWNKPYDFKPKTQKRAVKNMKHATKEWTSKERKIMIKLFLKMNEYDDSKRSCLDDLMKQTSLYCIKGQDLSI